MATCYILYNKQAGQENSYQSVKSLDFNADGTVKIIDVTSYTATCVPVR